MKSDINLYFENEDYVTIAELIQEGLEVNGVCNNDLLCDIINVHLGNFDVDQLKHIKGFIDMRLETLDNKKNKGLIIEK